MLSSMAAFLCPKHKENLMSINEITLETGIHFHDIEDLGRAITFEDDIDTKEDDIDTEYDFH